MSCFQSYPAPYKTISSNNDSTDDVKYRITDRYRLTIVKLTLKDEGTYRCRMKNQEYEASLVVLVRPSSVKLSWPRDRDWVEKGKKSRLTCSVKQSRPRATFRWFLATKDITSQAVSPKPTSTSKTGE
ncbi:hypothetical protein NP493_15g00057 [Ridgeia piscesae]|uniref:Ig-like domain-containing protein n=1 Tax=Ridgeia piscesae TaxID=27915 RepID=A0AAD9UL61_RIDPI|nr:hypothetical protein NP493_15g00057 [Ridgeia piscesae]